MSEIALPGRVQRKRVAGWRMPAGAVYVGRPGRWANPFVGDAAAYWFRLWLHIPGATIRDMIHAAASCGCVTKLGRCAFGLDATAAKYLEGIEALRGRSLACWCVPWKPCHADVLIEFANRGRRSDGSAA